MNFWKDLEGPIFALAPMEDVSETVFRELVAATASPGRLHVLFTEFMSVDGFLHERGHLRVSERLLVTPGYIPKPLPCLVPVSSWRWALKKALARQKYKTFSNSRLLNMLSGLWQAPFQWRPVRPVRE